jgi:hypothetical protein
MLKIIKTMALLSVFLALPVLVHAQPVVTGITGTYLHGTEISVSGLAFGTKTTAAPALWEDFNDGEYNGQPITDVLSEWVIGGVGFNTTVAGAAEKALFENSVRYGNRGYSVKVRTPDPITGNGENKNVACCWPKKWSVGLNGKMYASFKFRFTGGDTWYNECPQQFKVMGIGNATDVYLAFTSYPNIPYIYQNTSFNLYSYHHPDGQTDNVTNPILGHFTGHKYTVYGDTWISVEVEFTLPSAILAQDGSVKSVAYADGFTDYKTRTGFGIWDETGGDITNDFDAIWFRNYMPTLAAGCDTMYTINTDDVYVDVSWSRILIGNASTFSACTHKELQIPSAWEPYNITATFNLGTFTSTEGLYLFVVNSDGVASAGFPFSNATLKRITTSDPLCK